MRPRSPLTAPFRWMVCRFRGCAGIVLIWNRFKFKSARSCGTKFHRKRQCRIRATRGESMVPVMIGRDYFKRQAKTLRKMVKVAQHPMVADRLCEMADEFESRAGAEPDELEGSMHSSTGG